MQEMAAVYTLNLQPHPHKVSIYKSKKKSKKSARRPSRESESSSPSRRMASKTRVPLHVASSLLVSGTSLSDSADSVGSIDRIPPTKFIVPIKPQRGQSCNLILLDRLVHFFGRPKLRTKSSRFGKRWFTKTVPSESFGCAVDKRGRFRFFGPGRAILPRNYRWVFDPETENPMDRVETHLAGEASILYLTGHQLALVQDEYLNLWPLSQGVWLVVTPARVLSVMLEPNESCSPAPSFGEPHGYSTSIRRSSDNSTCAMLLSVPLQSVAVVQDDLDIVILQPGLRVLSKPNQNLIRFVSLQLQTLIIPLQITLSNDWSLRFEFFLEWRVTDVQQLLLKNCILANPAKLFTSILTKLLTRHILEEIDSWVKSLDEIYHVDNRSFIASFEDKVEKELSHWCDEVGICLTNMTWGAICPVHQRDGEAN